MGFCSKITNFQGMISIFLNNNSIIFKKLKKRAKYDKINIGVKIAKEGD